jgi:RNA polymerase sigma factor (sigma-70 family)
MSSNLLTANAFSMSASLQTEQWVKAARAGEEQAWACLYNQYYPGLYPIALGLCNHTQMAKDAVQDAFVTAWLKMAQLKTNAAFGGWIRQIVIRNCYRGLRGLGGLDERNREEMAANRLVEDGQTAKWDNMATHDRLYASMSCLPPSLHSTVMLRYFSGFQSYEDIARILCVPVGTVRSRLHQAKLKLVDEWQRHVDSGTSFFEQSEEWNHFYLTAFSAMHHHDNYKNRFVHHLQKDMQVVLAGGKQDNGRRLFEKMVMEDRSVGSWLAPVNVVSCGNISVVEARHFNSAEHPHHCPLRSVLVLYRNKKEVSKMNFHVSTQ